MPQTINSVLMDKLVKPGCREGETDRRNETYKGKERERDGERERERWRVQIEGGDHLYLTCPVLGSLCLLSGKALQINEEAQAYLC